MNRSWTAKLLTLVSVVALTMTATVALAQPETQAPDDDPPGEASAPAVASSDDADVPEADRFRQVTLIDDVDAGMRLRVADDGRVILAERDGTIRVWDPESESTDTAGQVAVEITGEAGMIGLELAPDFDETGHLYLHWSPPNWEEHYVTRV